MTLRIMNIEVLGEISFDELREKIRSVPLMNKREDGSNIYVYGDANISLREFDVGDVNPTSFYVIRDNMRFQRELREELLKQGIDSLHLDRAYELKNDKGEIWTLMPPVIEVASRDVRFVPMEGELKYNDVSQLNIPIINDGMHRVSLARELGDTFNGIYISGVLKEFPFYAHPNGWSRVKEVDKVPASKEEKKFYSRENCYGLYRDFGFLGCGAPRGVSK